MGGRRRKCRTRWRSISISTSTKFHLGATAYQAPCWRSPRWTASRRAPNAEVEPPMRRALLPPRRVPLLPLLLMRQSVRGPSPELSQVEDPDADL